MKAVKTARTGKQRQAEREAEAAQVLQMRDLFAQLLAINRSEGLPDNTPQMDRSRLLLSIVEDVTDALNGMMFYEIPKGTGELVLRPSPEAAPQIRYCLPLQRQDAQGNALPAPRRTVYDTVPTARGMLDRAKDRSGTGTDRREQPQAGRTAASHRDGLSGFETWRVSVIFRNIWRHRSPC